MHIRICTCIIMYFAQVNCIDMTPPIVEELKSLEEEGVMAFDAFLQTMVLVVAPVICITCDNPRASEVTNNLGPSSKMFCRICMVGNINQPLFHCILNMCENNYIVVLALHTRLTEMVTQLP